MLASCLFFTASSRIYDIRDDELPIGLCITGQLARLEVTSKVNNILKASIKSGYTFDVVLALQNQTEGLYTNRHHVDSLGSLSNETSSTSTTKNSLELHSRYYKESFVEKTALWWEMNHDYVHLLDKQYMTWTERVTRSKSHVAQWYHLSRCWREFENLENQYRFRYKAFLRLRDDAFVLEPVSFAAIDSLSTLTDPTIIVPSCEQWDERGINDKGAIVNRAAAHSYFTSPLDFYFLDWGLIEKKGIHKLNPELYLSLCYQERNITILRSTATIPIMSSLRVPHSENLCLRGKFRAKTWRDSVNCYLRHLPHLTSNISSSLCIHDEELLFTNKKWQHGHLLMAGYITSVVFMWMLHCFFQAKWMYLQAFLVSRGCRCR